MRLFIAEKPDLGRAIAEGLGGKQERGDGFIKIGEDIITWCFGHLLELKNPAEYDEKYKLWNLADLPFAITKLELKPSKGKEKQIAIIKRLLKEADIVVNAGDPDEEGQLLVDELLDFLGWKKEVKRILINDNTKAAVEKSLANLKDNKDFIGLKNSALVRSLADWKYGLNLTRAYTQKVSFEAKARVGVMSVGRVQTPILSLVFEREQEVKNHVKEYFYNLFTDNGFKYNIPKEKLEDKLCKDKDYLENIKKESETNNNFIIENIEVKEVENHPPLPFNLLELQAESFKKFKYKPDKVKDITQSLREHHKAITYNRSDCQYLTDEHYAGRNGVIKVIRENIKEFNNLTLENLDSTIKHKAFNNKNVSAHHAIIPTLTRLDVNKLSLEERNIYELIAERYLMLFLPPEVVERTTYSAINSTKLEFNITTSKVLKPSSIKVVAEKSEEEKEEEATGKLSYKKGDSANFKSFNIKEGETKPKSLYTFATLLKDLTQVAKYIKNPELKKLLIEKDKDKKGESGGIGTPATRDTIIKTLFERTFLVEEKGKLLTTETGKKFLLQLPEAAKTPDMTALWSEKQRLIKDNKLSVEEFIASIDEFVAKEIQEIKEKLNQKGYKERKPMESTNFNKTGKKEVDKTHSCPKCKTGFLQAKTGPYGNFWGCNNYPNCKTTFKDKEGSPLIK